MKKVINLSATPLPKPTEITDSPALTELIEEIGEENLLTTTTEQLIEATSAKAPKPDVYRLLKTLNLTDEETNDLVSHVEKVVREELVRKLAEARLSEHMTGTSQRPSNDVSTIEATTIQSSTAFESDESQIEARIKVPDQMAKTEKELLLYIPRKKPKPEIKHHPQRLSADDGASFVEAEILTSQMHLPVEDDDTSEAAGELPETEAYESDKGQEIISTTIATTAAPTTTTQISTSPTAPPINHQKLHIRDLNSTVEKSKLLSSYGGIDADLLNNIALATGAPLDLEAEGTQLVAYRARNTGRAPSTTLAPSTISRSMVGRPKTTSPPKTPFERLAVDYKERLTGAGDMDKFLKTIYSNAYIALVDAKEASSVRIPMSMRRAQASLG
ncbi:unnamed protein product [Cylicocyclus nassatus]|uniref:Uncharacterized protein n=1 Tax=Cylicocyclus nassatus TaxID=53992 RepID=A0AA36GY85_CYLNA|nr:unnamed protein product [Cylicocyclus nassatus]